MKSGGSESSPDHEPPSEIMIDPMSVLLAITPTFSAELERAPHDPALAWWRAVKRVRASVRLRTVPYSVLLGPIKRDAFDILGVANRHPQHRTLQ